MARNKFPKGTSGNPKGRPKGIVDKRTALRTLLEPHAPQLIARVVAKALKGDMTAARICIDRLIPPVKAQDVPVDIGPLTGTLTEQAARVLKALSDKTITPDQASTVMSAVSTQAQILRVDELAERVRQLEEKLAVASGAK